MTSLRFILSSCFLTCLAMTQPLPFYRYHSLVDDWNTFLHFSQQPLAPAIWTNTLRTIPEALRHQLAEEDIYATPCPWNSAVFRLPPLAKPGTSFSYLLGLLHIQEEVAALPVHLLAPQPGEYGLDLCAAPGNKTAQIAVQMNNQGLIVANDRSASRLRVLATTIRRLGLTNIVATTEDATSYPKQEQPFDFVLADVPCSCEGTSRKHAKVIQQSSREQSQALARIQTAILWKAVQLCKPGGRIVYATCTYAPEENEGVVNTVLQKYGDDQLCVRPWQIEGFETTPGITTWETEAFHPSLKHTRRIWPHHNNTGGFYIALLEKR